MDDRERKVPVDDLEANPVPPDKLRAVDETGGGLDALGPTVVDRVLEVLAPNIELDDLALSPRPEDLEDKLLGAVIPETRVPALSLVIPLLPVSAPEIDVVDDFGRRRGFDSRAPIAAAPRPISLVSLRNPRAGAGAIDACTGRPVTLGGPSGTVAGVGCRAGMYASSSLRIYSSKSSFMHAARSLHSASIGSFSEFTRRCVDAMDPERCKVADIGPSDVAVAGRVDVDWIEAEDVGRETGSSISWSLNDVADGDRPI